MTLKTSCSKAAMFRKTVSRFWPLWAAYLAILLLMLPLGLSNDLQYNSTISITDVQQYLYTMTQASVGDAFVMAPIAAMCVFSHLYNDRHAGAYASLPIKRENMFLSCTLAGLIPQLLSGLIATLAVLGVQASYGVVDFASTFTFLGIFCLNTITFYGFAVLCAQMTGTILVVPAVYIVLQFTAFVVQALVQALMELFLYGYSHSSLDFSVLSPLLYLINHVDFHSVREILANGSSRVVAYTFEGWLPCALYAVSGFVFLALSFFLYRKRRMEASGDFVAYKPLKPVFKWTLGLGCGLILSTLMAGLFHSERTDTILGIPSGTATLLFLLLGGFVGFFGAEMLLKKTFRVFEKKAWKGFLIFGAAALVLHGTLVFDFFGYERRIPDLEDIESVHLQAQGDSGSFYDPTNIQKVIRLHEGAITTQQENKKARTENWDDMRYDTKSFFVTYFLKNGSVLERRYHLCDTGPMLDVLRQVEEVMNSEEAISTRVPNPAELDPKAIRYAMIGYTVETQPLSQQSGTYAPAFQHESRSLTAAEAYDLYVNCIYPDMLENTTGTVCFGEDSPYFNPTYDGSIEFEVLFPESETDELGRPSSYYYFVPTLNSKRTCAWLEAHGITMLEQEYIESQYEEADRLNIKTEEVIVTHNEAASIGIIGGADGPTSIVVAG